MQERSNGYYLVLALVAVLLSIGGYKSGVALEIDTETQNSNGLIFMPLVMQERSAVFDCSRATGVPVKECLALVAIYQSTGGEDWENVQGWLQTNQPCTWFGVTCANQHVVRLKLPNNNLKGPLPPEIGNLQRLIELDFGENQLETLPGSIGNLTELSNFNANYNQIRELPPQIGDMQSLKSLDLSSNLLVSLPAEIGSLANLHNLSLEDNLLQELPAEIGSLTVLGTLRLRHNRLASLPVEVGNLSSLYLLELCFNQLTSLPAGFSGLNNLKTLYLSNNLFTEFPGELSSLAGLFDLDLSGNQLDALPPEIGNLSSLGWLELNWNNLTSLPEEIGSLTLLLWLDLSHNLIVELPASIGYLQNLHALDLSKNLLVSLPEEIGNLSSLRFLWLDHNELSALPPGFVNLSGVTRLSLDNNPLSGEIPAFFVSFTNLEIFTFHNTNWCVPGQGPLPEWLGKIQYLTGTGLLCGYPAGQISGEVFLPDGSRAQGIQVTLYRDGPYWEQTLVVDAVFTSGEGEYLFSGLGQGIGYRISFIDPNHQYAPQFFDNKYSLWQADPITLPPGGSQTGVNAILTPAVPQAALVETTDGSITYDIAGGSAWVNIPYSKTGRATVTVKIHCSDGLEPENVRLTVSPPLRFYPMLSSGAGVYTVELIASHGSDWTVWASCREETIAIYAAHSTYYHPMGTIQDALTGDPLTGAVVSLYYVPGWFPKTSPLDNRSNTCQSARSQPADQGWSQPAPIDKGVISNRSVFLVPGLPYQKTAGDGYYGWELHHGCWYLDVRLPGYLPSTSPVFGILPRFHTEPQVTDLDIYLQPAPE